MLQKLTQTFNEDSDVLWSDPTSILPLCLLYARPSLDSRTASMAAVSRRVGNVASLYHDNHLPASAGWPLTENPDKKGPEEQPLCQRTDEMPLRSKVRGTLR